MGGNVLVGADSSLSMKSGGYYSARTRGAKHVIDNTEPLVMDALARMDIAGAAARPFSIADYGCADGGTSLELMGRIVGAVRERAPKRPVTLTYTDLPRNDFSQLFRNTQGVGGEGDFLRGYDDLYVFASGASFHRQVLPSGSLDLGFSATAMHYISEIPVNIPNHLQAVGAEGEVLAAYAERGQKDWESILLARAAELVPGGRLVFANFGKDEEGRYLGNTGGVNMFDTYDALWKALRDDGTITAREYADTNFQQYYKTPEEFTRPFDDPASPVSKAGLTVEHLHTQVVPCPYRAEFEASGDVEAFAPALVGTLRSWSEIVFMTGLDEKRPLEEKRAIVDRYYKSYEDLVRRSPDGHAMDYVHIYMVIRKD